MDITVKILPKSSVEVKVTLPWEEWSSYIEHAAEHMAEKTKLPGFRPGKAPKAIIEQRFGRTVLLIEAAEHAVEHSYADALKRKDVDAIGRPEVKLDDVKDGEPLEYTVVTAVIPEVTLKDWRKAAKKVNAEFSKKKEAAIDAKAVDAELKKLAEMRAPMVTVNRVAQDSDAVEVDFKVLQDGVPIENGSADRHHLVLGSGMFIPGFEEQLIGMKENDEKTFELAFPEEYHAKNLAGKPATFDVKLRLVQERQIPALDDVFASTVGKFTTLDELKKNISEGLIAEREEKKKTEHRTALLESLVSESAAEFPEVMIDDESLRMVSEFRSQIESMGMTWDSYIERMGKNEEALREEWRPQAIKRLLSGLALEQLAKDEDLSVEQSAVEEEMNRTLAQYKNVKDIEKKIDLNRLYLLAKEHLENEKVLEWMESV